MTVYREIQFNYQDDALRKIYDRRIRAKLASILERLELNPDANMGLHVETWYPDPDIRVDYNVQPGVTERIVRVRVTRVERKQSGSAKKTRKRTTEYVPYLWIGAASYNHTSRDTYQETPPMPWVFGFEPEPVTGYTFYNTLEASEGKPSWCGTGYCGPTGTGCTPWPECGTFNGPDVRVWPDRCYEHYGVACEGTGILRNEGPFEGGDRWPHFGTWKIEITNIAQWNTLFNFFFDDLLWEWNTDNSNEYYLVAKTSRTGMALMSQPATQLFAPVEAYRGGLPAHYWQLSVVADNGAMRPVRQTATAYARYDDDYFARGKATWDGTVLPCEIVSGVYRFDFALLGFECSPDECRGLHVRMILGKPFGGFTEEGDPDGYLDPDIGGKPSSVTVVDFYIEDIGSNPNQTVINGYSNRDLALGGCRDAKEYEDDADPMFWGPNAAATGFWKNSLYVDVQGGSYQVREFSHLRPFYEEGGNSNFHECECVDEEGSGSFSDSTHPGGSTYYTLNVSHVDGGIRTININTCFIHQLATIIYRCDDYILAKMVGNRGQCGGCFGDGSVQQVLPFRRAGGSYFQDLSYQLHSGDLVQVTGVGPYSQILGVTKFEDLDPVMRTYQWGVDHRCPDGFASGQWIRGIEESGPYNLRKTATGEWVPYPLTISYSKSLCGFVIS